MIFLPVIKKTNMVKVLILGANGMLGGSLFRYLSKTKQYEVLGTVRSTNSGSGLKIQGFDNFITGLDVLDEDKLLAHIENFTPDFVINCVGIIKQLGQSKDPTLAIKINSLLPHKVATICNSIGAKLIHFSTDCVFSGEDGDYTESSLPDARDLYGRSKLLGEVSYDDHLTFRTSIVGHEIDSAISLVDWFLSQTDSVKGYSKAIFSGLPTVCVAQFLDKYVLSGNQLTGLYHLSAEPIDKLALLNLVGKVYNHNLKIENYENFKIDRSLNSKLLRKKSGFEPLTWGTMIELMHNEFEQYFGKY